ncbi:MAG: GNAT family N-acetyltransferase [Proteobacteria bacterium]|nr:GNAT family N-acetyltransferase [Pseudomonadota bacterium]
MTNLKHRIARTRKTAAVPAHSLRSATMADARLLLDWRNDTQTRANSRQHGLVVWHAHLDWLATVLCDPARELLIAELNGVAVGTVRLDTREDDTVLSWTVAPEHRGKGLGRRMVELAVDRVPHRRLTAEIAIGNERSMAIAKAAGFQLDHSAGDMMVWLRPRLTGSARGGESLAHGGD